MGQPFSLTLYRWSVLAATSLLYLYLLVRRQRGKEDPARWGERLGHASQSRPAGPLVWFHAASVGEALSILSLLERFRNARPDVSVLVTTGTVTSARLMAQRLPPCTIHQYAPVDHPRVVRRFLDYWAPQMAVWVESELWPGILGEIRKRNIPAVLVNGRISARSTRRWKGFAPGLARWLSGSFRQILAQNEDYAENFRRLGTMQVEAVPSLKYDTPLLPCDPVALEALKAAIGGRPTWLLASSHAGEETLAAAAHSTLKSRWPGFLTVIVPRHPQRGTTIAESLSARGLHITRRSTDGLPGSQTDIYIADTLGELGLFFRLVPVVCMGNSLVPPGGGHNPVEPLQLDSCVLYGPWMGNFPDMATAMEGAGATIRLKSADDLAETVHRLLGDGAGRERLTEAGRNFLARQAQGTDRTLQVLLSALESL
ncbi:MAG: 3-deoxy-D-manno-octulosonic acid transferase [Pseudomonadota bacterium]|nr:3-deoxy-D-manno-octulosonic acid transferase [Pseudomonadota bacterium]